VLNCEKSFVTSAGYADYYVVSSLAVGAKGPTESTLYLVEKNAAGIIVSKPLERDRPSRQCKRSYLDSKLPRRRRRALTAEAKDSNQ